MELLRPSPRGSAALCYEVLRSGAARLRAEEVGQEVQGVWARKEPAWACLEAQDVCMSTCRALIQANLLTLTAHALG